MKIPSNVVIFPKGKKDSPPITMQDLMGSVAETRMFHADMILDVISENIMDLACDEGFPLGQEDDVPHLVFMMESIKSALMHSIGIEHPFQDLAHEHIRVMDEKMAAEEEEENNSNDDS